LTDKTLYKIFLTGIFIVLIIWSWYGVQWGLEHIGSGADLRMFTWINTRDFITRNLSIVIAVYGFICLQIAGYAELRHGQRFLTAFALSLILTPLGLLIFTWKKSDK